MRTRYKKRKKVSVCFFKNGGGGEQFPTTYHHSMESVILAMTTFSSPAGSEANLATVMRATGAVERAKDLEKILSMFGCGCGEVIP